MTGLSGPGGWHKLGPGISLWLMFLGATLFAPLFAGTFILTLIDVVRLGRVADGWDWAFLILSPALAALFAYGWGYVLLVRISYDATQIVWSFLGRSRSYRWGDVERIAPHWLHGYRVSMRDGSTIAVWEYLRGFDAMLERAAERGVRIDI